MSNFLVINCGTSSVKITLFNVDEDTPKRIVDGHLKYIFSSHPVLEVNKKKISVNAISSYGKAIEMIIHAIEKEGFTFSPIDAVGHRVVHGGEQYTESVLITPLVKNELAELSQLAPLHNPPAMEGISCTQKLFPHVPQIAVFDTAFHATLPKKAATYPIPLELSQKYGIKRYGFHGIAHAFSWDKYLSSFGKKKPHHKVITAHLGGGSSLAAIENGISVDTSMGFTPLDGVMMSSRSGELDPSIVAFLCDKEKKSPKEIIEILNHKSGILGVSCKTDDINEILKSPDPQAQLALEMYIYHILKKIGSFIAILGEIDAIIFSGGIGENVFQIRSKLAHSLSWYSVLIDDKENESCINLKSGEIKCVNDPRSKVLLCIVGSDENLFIAKEMMRF